MANEFVETTLVDGFADGPHITEKQVGLANKGLYGPDDYVLSSGRKSEAQLLTNNSIRIFDAVYVIQGRRDVIAANDYTDVGIDNGAQGMNRNDIIVRRYTKDNSSEIEKTEYAVIKGTPTSETASDPAVTTGDIRSGALKHEMKLYRVKLEGLNIVAVEPLFRVLMDMSTINEDLSELQAKLAGYEYSRDEQIIGRWINGQSLYRKFVEIGNFSSGQSTIVPHKIQGLSRLVQISGMALKTTDGTMMSIPFAATDPAYSISVTINTQNIELKHGTGRSSYWAMVILEYIKNN